MALLLSHLLSLTPSAAKGLNLAVADVRLLAAAFTAWYQDGTRDLLDGYSRACSAAVWQGQEFSALMTSLLHRFPGENGYIAKLRQARLRDVVTSRAAATAFAEHYVGLARARLAGGDGRATDESRRPAHVPRAGPRT